MEHFSYNEGLGISVLARDNPSQLIQLGLAGIRQPRFGGWRLIELFEEFGFPLTVLLNTECYEHCPELVAAFRSRGDEIVAHGRTNAENQNGMSPEAERSLIAEATAAIARYEGRSPRGWMSPGANPSERTEDLLAEAGYAYTLDWPLDDQPVWMKTAGGDLLSVPYPQEINDVPLIVSHHGSGAYADAAIDNFDEMLTQSARQPLACGITIHTFIVGQPFRIRQFRRALSTWPNTATRSGPRRPARSHRNTCRRSNPAPPPETEERETMKTNGANGAARTRVALAGLGVIGIGVAKALDKGLTAWNWPRLQPTTRERPLSGSAT